VKTFEWKREPEAEAFILDVLEKSKKVNPFISKLEDELTRHASARLFDFLDHVRVLNDPSLDQKLLDLGFQCETTSLDHKVYIHKEAKLPRVQLINALPEGVAIKVEEIASFLSVRGLGGEIEGDPFTGYRRCLLNTENNVGLYVIERRASTSFEPTKAPIGYYESYFFAKELWRTRPRALSDEDFVWEKTFEIVEKMVEILGKDLAATVVLEEERAYWQSRNTAGALQKNRQDRLGLGFANHDHHTFRSSRRYFHKLVTFFERLGFHCRERFYAGQEALWGAQVMENSVAELVLFLDVDLSPEELTFDFAHTPLNDLEKLGTIGLWCGLHGDSLLKAGMHHLEAQFLFEELTEDLKHLGVSMMKPFSHFEYLKQAFTAGEVWRVDPFRIKKLLEEKKITEEEGEKFLHYGAVGSHLENLQRREGYKGFNQKNVSVIIKETDPRKS
jgi:hypothetical protein